MDARLRQFVRQRANGCCEYCGMTQEREPLLFHIEHIVPRQHGGADNDENLALACLTAISAKARISPALILKPEN